MAGGQPRFSPSASRTAAGSIDALAGFVPEGLSAGVGRHAPCRGSPTPTPAQSTPLKGARSPEAVLYVGSATDAREVYVGLTRHRADATVVVERDRLEAAVHG